MSTAPVWEQFTRDPRLDQHAHLRASDRDRDVVREQLSTAYAEGRIDRDELDERTEAVTGAKTLGQLAPLLRDLVPAAGAAPAVSTHAVPGDLHAEAERRYRQQRRQALLAFLTPTLICWVVWFLVLVGASGPEFPWPVFVTLGTGVRYGQLVVGRRDAVAGIEQRLVRREARRLEARQRRERRRGTGPSALG